jgi:hypothetical protein
VGDEPGVAIVIPRSRSAGQLHPGARRARPVDPDHALDVRTGDGAAIQGLEHVRLDALGAGWNAIGEIELWGSPPDELENTSPEVGQRDVTAGAI